MWTSRAQILEPSPATSQGSTYVTRASRAVNQTRAVQYGMLGSSISILTSGSNAHPTLRVLSCDILSPISGSFWNKINAGQYPLWLSLVCEETILGRPSPEMSPSLYRRHRKPSIPVPLSAGQSEPDSEDSRVL